MLDRDLAELYDVETKQLKRQVRRNNDRFPDDFMFQLTEEELEDWRSQFGTSKSDLKGLRYPPFAFTEHGVLMLSSVLNSQRAVQVNIQIMRVYARMKELLLTHKDILIKLEQLENQVNTNSKDIQRVFAVLKELLAPPRSPRKQIGFKIQGK